MLLIEKKPYKRLLITILPSFMILGNIMLSCGNAGINKKNTVNIDSLFIRWNKATFSSIERNEKLKSNTEQQRILLLNREISYKAFYEIDDLNQINKKSVRYLFLKAISNNLLEDDATYVIEENKHGEAIEIENYIIELKKYNYFNITKYSYTNGMWSIIKMESANNPQKVIDSIGSFTNNHNDDDVIISKFTDGKLQYSDFYLIGMLSKNYLINKIWAK